MPSIFASKRAPENLDYASPSQFRFQIARIPEVEFFIVATNIPQISLSGDAEINTPFKQIAFGGDTVEYDDLSVRFLVNEDLTNYLLERPLNVPYTPLWKIGILQFCARIKLFSL